MEENAALARGGAGLVGHRKIPPKRSAEVAEYRPARPPANPRIVVCAGLCLTVPLALSVYKAEDCILLARQQVAPPPLVIFFWS